MTFNHGVRGSSPRRITNYAGVAELADALDLGSSALRRGGSTPFTCTKLSSAGVTQLVECHLAKVDVASSSLVFRSTQYAGIVYR